MCYPLELRLSTAFRRAAGWLRFEVRCADGELPSAGGTHYNGRK